jgi:predicted ATPase
MRSVVITGGPGVGKTTLLAELSAMGYATVEESARAIIKERLGNGLSPRPDAMAFAHEIFHRDTEKYRRWSSCPDWVFFDRGAVEALAMLNEVSALAVDELEHLLRRYQFHRSAFVLPPWGAIYTTDAERDQSFAEAQDVHLKVVTWYRACGYELHEVPRLPVQARAEHVLSVLGSSDA